MRNLRLARVLFFVLLLLLVACGPAGEGATPDAEQVEVQITATAVPAATVAAADPTDTPLPLPSATRPAEATSTRPVVIDPTPTTEPLNEESEYEIITVMARDAIPAISNPQFLTAEEAAEFYQPEEGVIGVVFSGEARAYSIPLLSRHEIVNDTVGGVKIAVTW